LADHTFYEGQDLEALADLPNYQSAILRAFRPHLRGRVLEVGAGVGNIAALVEPLADELVLLEPATNLEPRLRDRFRGTRRVKVAPWRIEDAFGRAIDDVVISPSSFDAVVSVNVLEHVEDDAAMLADIRHALKPTGALLLFVPALPILYGSLDRLVGHFRRYERASLVALLERCGFRVDDCRYFDALGMLPWLLAGRVLRMHRFDDRGARLYDRIAFPLTERFERKVSPALGKNLIAVARAAST
jgi:SAM-dependent methyltransferase